MIIKFHHILMLFGIILGSNIAQSAEPLEFLASETLKSFKSAIDQYNKSTTDNLPKIKKIKAQYYQFLVKKTVVRFSALSVLNNQYFINNRIYSQEDFIKKQVFFIPLIQEVYAAENEIDGETTKIILATLSQFTKNLEEAGMVCFAGCQKEVRNQNLKKILKVLDTQLNNCQEQAYAQQETIDKFPSYRMVSLLHSTFNPEFQSLLSFFKKMSEQNKKMVEDFMKNKLINDKKSQSCQETMLTGTIADTNMNMLAKGLEAAKSKLITGEAMEQALENAKSVCLRMDELKECLVTVKNNLNSINSIKREQSKIHNMKFDEESLPNLKNLER
jgi:hypothetical protein